MSVASLRRWHSYIGLFIAPSVLFFALTGAAQLFGLHEEHGKYRPPAVIEKLSSVHKDQVFDFGNHHARPDQESGGGETPVNPAPPAGAEDTDQPRLPTLMLKGFFLIVAIGLSISAALGLWIGLTQTRAKRASRFIVAVGTLIPLVLLIF